MLAALGENVPENAFDAMEKLHELTETDIPAPLAELAGLPVRHRDCIAKEEMLTYVRSRMEG